MGSTEEEMNENLQKYYEYLKSVKADVPATYDSFATTMGDETQAKTYYNYLKTNKFDTPDTFDSFTETLGLKKKGISGEVSATASQGSSTQPQPLTSDEINKNYQDLLSKSYPPENPFIQVAESTKPQTGVQKPLYVPTLRDYLNRYGITPKDLDMAENANLDRQLRPGEQENYDQTLKVKGLDKKPPTSYFWGTLKEQGLMPASLLRDMDNTVKFLASLPIINKFTNVGKVAGLLGEERTKGGLLRHSGTFGTTADWMENQLQNTPNLPQTDIGKVVGGVIGLEPMFLEMGVMPQGKLATIAGKDIVASRFLNQMVAKGFTSGYAKQLYKEPEKVGKATVEGLKQAGISGAQAVAFSALGYGSSKLGQAIVEETKSGVAGVASNILANSTGFAGYTFMEQVLSGQPVDKDAIKQSALLGGVLALQPFAEFALNRAVGNYLTSSPAVEQASQELNGTPAEARDQSADIREQAKSEPDVQKQASQETGANLIDALADVKVISDEVKKDPMPFIKAVEESDLPKEQQEIFKQKIFDTAKQAVPEEKLKAQQDIDDLQQQIKDINDNEALPEEQRKLDVAPLKEKLKVKQEEFANIKIKEPIKKEEEQTNASKNRTGNQQKPEEGTPETKQGSETIGDVRNNEQTGTTEQQKQEEVTAQSKEPIKVLPNDKKVENIPPVQENKPFTFLEHKANIEQKLKGSPIADKLSPEVKKIFDRLLTEQETPVEVKTEASLPLSPESGTPTPPEEKVPEKPLNELEKPNEREKTLLARFKNAKNLSDVFKEHVDKNGMTYEQIPNNITVADVDALIAENGVGKTENEIYNTSNDLPPRVRALASVRVVKMLDSFADEAAKEGDTKAEADYRLRSVKIAEFVDNTVREWGRGIQILASDEVNATLAPKSAVIMAKRAVRRQRDRQQKYFKKDIDKKAESMKEANKQSIDEAMASKIYSKAKSGITGKPDNVIERDVKVSVDKIKREQEFRKPHWEALKQSFKRPGASLSAGVIPLSAEQVTAITQIVGSYVREGYYRTEILAKKLAQDWKKFVGEDLSEDDAIKMLPQEIEGKKLSDLQNEGGKIDAATKLANRVERMLQDPKTPKYDPVKQMVETLFKKIQEKDIKEKEKPERKSIISVIKEAIQNRDEYSEVWDAAKAEIKDRLESSSDLSEQQKADYDNRLEDFYKEVIGQPFAEKQVEGAVKKEIKDLDISIDKVVKEHYTVYDATKRTLQEKLIDELGVSGDDAKMIADAVSKEFDKIAVAKKQAILQKGITPREIVRKTTAKKVWDKLIEDTNMGAFSDADFAEVYADKWGFPKLTDEQAKEIERLANKVYESPEGFPKYEAIQDLLSYQTKLPGIDKGQLGMSVWYSFILSGVRTQWKNILQNNLNTLAEFGVASIRHPLSMPGLAVSWWKGTQRGWYEAGHVLKTGYNPIKGGKIEAPSTTELLSPKNIVGLTKYVTRWMVAADIFTYGGLKEMRSYELAMNLARAENASADKPTMSTWKKASEILNNTSDREKEASAQATQEGMMGNAHKRRVWEIMEQGRPKEMIEDAANFASRGTFNHPTEGILGLMTDGINSVIQKTEIKTKNPFTGKSMTVMPLKFVVPFTRIIANVANVALDYFPPVSLTRAATGQMGLESMGSKYREYTKEERQKLLIKASLGIAAQVGIYMLSHHKDDKGNSVIEITANGYGGDYTKNNELKERGWQPYSIRIGEHWYSYQYTPLVLTLAPIGLMNDMGKYQPDKVDGESLLALYGRANFNNLRTFSDMTWATTLSSFMAAISTGDPAKGGTYLSNLATSTAKGFIYPKIIEQTVQAIDAMQKNPRKEAQGFIGKVTRDLPIVRNKYNVMLNAVGEPVYYDLVQMAGKVKHDPFWDYVDKHNLTIGKPMAKTPIYDDINKVERGMNDDEYYEFIKKSGQEIKRRITEEVMTKDLSEDDIQKDITNIKTEVRRKFKTELFGWGQLRHNNPDDWKLIRDNDALQVPRSSEEITIGKEKLRIGEERGVPSKELEEFNNIAMEEYRKRVINYLKNTNAITANKAKIDSLTGKSRFDEKIDEKWTEAIAIAKQKITKTIKSEQKINKQ